MRMCSAGNRRGLSLVEVVVAIGVLGIAVSILLGIITPLLGSLAKAQETDKAIDVRAHVRRYVKAMPYESLVEGTEAQQVVVFNCEGFDVCLKRSALYDPDIDFLPLQASLAKKGRVYYNFTLGKQAL